MAKVLIEESALETMKVMVQRLQDERDMLLDTIIFSRLAMLEASGKSMPAAREVAREVAEAIENARAAIAACTESKQVMG